MDIVGLCNLALDAISSARIAALTENSREAKACNTHFTTAFEAVLEECDWTFARSVARGVALGDTGQPSIGYSYRYALPADAIAVRKVFQEGEGRNARPWTFKLTDIPGSTGRALHTDCPAAVMVYTKRLDDVVACSPKFIVALAHRLAKAMAIPLTRSQDQLKSQDALYKEALRDAAMSNAQAEPEIHGDPREEPDPEILTVRGRAG